jgi:hypothetical protein
MGRRGNLLFVATFESAAPGNVARTLLSTKKLSRRSFQKVLKLSKLFGEKNPQSIFIDRIKHTKIHSFALMMSVSKHFVCCFCKHFGEGFAAQFPPSPATQGCGLHLERLGIPSLTLAGLFFSSLPIFRFYA